MSVFFTFLPESFHHLPLHVEILTRSLEKYKKERNKNFSAISNKHRKFLEVGIHLIQCLSLLMAIIPPLRLF